MRKFMRWMVTILAVALLVAVVGVFLAVPVAVPPAVERLVVAKLAACGLTADADMDLRYRWRNGPALVGRLQVSLPGTPWRARANLSASCRGVSADVHMDETAFDESDPAFRLLLAKIPPQSVSNLTFSGKVSLDGRVDCRPSLPVPVWSVKMPIRGLDAHGFREGREISLAGLSATPAVSGIASHRDIRPAFVRAAALSVGKVALTNLTVSIQASERALLLTEAGAGFCGGRLSLYSLFLDLRSLNAGFTLFADNVDAGEALRELRGLRGEATGRLHGKVRLFVQKGGRAVRLHDAFLYSTPGEGGKIRIEDTDALGEMLSGTGHDDATRASVGDALGDLDYDVLKLTLKRTGDGEATLTTRVSGSATRGALTVPVDLTVNLHGEIEQLVNLGLDYSNKMKGKTP